MNRIYQGKVTRAQIQISGKDNQWQDIPDWKSRLWEHHALFQDAVNYYTLALAGLVADLDPENDQEKALADWRDRVRENWIEGRRKAVRYEGPHRQISRWLGVDPGMRDKNAAFLACVQAIYSGHPSTPQQKTQALRRLADEAGSSNLNQVAGDRLSFLCTEKFKGADKSISSASAVARQSLVRKFHGYTDDEAIARADEMSVGLFVTSAPKETYSGPRAKKELVKYWEKIEKKRPDLIPLKDAFFKCLDEKGAGLTIPSPGKKTTGLYAYASVFRNFPCKETWEIFREASRKLAAGKDHVIVSDPIAALRLSGLPPFSYFTNIVFERDADDNNRAAWFEFDKAAFIEALLPLNRYFQDAQSRAKEAATIKQKIAYVEGQGHSAASKSKGTDDHDDVESFYGFDGDQRINLLREILCDEVKGLAYLAEPEEAEAAAQEKPKEYSVQARTLRGWSKIRDEWRKLDKNGKVTQQALKDVLVKEQAAHRDDFGSAPLFQKLTEERYWSIWRDKGTEEWHAPDCLFAWQKYTELRRDLRDKSRPIRFTPAHAKHSPRYFGFPKSGPRGVSHEPDAMAFSTGVAMRHGQKWRIERMRLEYSAPRLKRDGVWDGGITGNWLQPMMQALGLPEVPKQEFENCEITLQAKARNEIQLTFPVKADSAPLISFIGKALIWDVDKKGQSKQFNLFPDGSTFRESSLRWINDKQPKNPPTPWHQKLDRFACLSVDLGQRDAGAFVRLEVAANKKDGRWRNIGKTPGKEWGAKLERSGMLRLPGEDRVEWRKKSVHDQDEKKAFDFRQELHGGRGRAPRDFETEQCRELIDVFLGKESTISFLLSGWDKEDSPAFLSFPEQNDKLLLAARRAQTHVARLHRWCWFLKDDKKRPIALSELQEALELSDDGLKVFLSEGVRQSIQKDRDPRLFGELEKLLKTRLRVMEKALVQLANRVLPLRGRSWRWEAHPAATAGNRIYLLTQGGADKSTEGRPTWIRGQRGLSMARIEQIEQLRQRFQAFNQTLRRDIGGKPPIRRDESVPDCCPDLLEKLDGMKEQRVNQTAHMILAEALGLRLSAPPVNKAELKKSRDQHGVYVKEREPVDFIVMENLSRYRASQGRGARENSRLMQWSHRAVRDKLRQICEPFGIPVVETPAAYSSRFCSRTGVAGFRAVEVTAGFEDQAPWCWLKTKKKDSGEPTEEASLISQAAEELHAAQSALDKKYGQAHPGATPPKRTLLLPQTGGPIFVAATVPDHLKDVMGKGLMQADINAAINLGLRAVADPRIWDIHPRVRTVNNGAKSGGKGKRGKQKKDADAPTLVVSLIAREKRKFGDKLIPLELQKDVEDPDTDDARNPNYFFDVAKLACFGGATIADPGCDQPVPLSSGKGLWKRVKDIQWKRAMEINKARLGSWREKDA